VDNEKYRAVFSRTNAGVLRQPPGTVLLYPDNPGWNDFGFQVRAKLRIAP
jgi:RNA:NAD 2'-phosphotransferase (TPT1/KptA family)